MNLTELGIILFGISFIAIIIGIRFDIRDYERRKKRHFSYICIGFVMSFILFPTLIFGLACMASQSFDDIKAIAISPAKATAEIDNFYPWGVTIDLENGQSYKTRVEDPELLVDMLSSGALIGKRANSLDFYCYINNDTICIPFEQSRNIPLLQSQKAR